MSAKARWTGRGLLLGLALLFALNVAWIARNWGSLRVVTTPAGTAAPDFTVQLLDGKAMHLSDARGQVLVLAFWATWCRPCKAELPGRDRLYRRFAPDGTRFLAVNIEGAELKPQVDAFVTATGLSMPVAIAGGAIADRYHVETIPHLVILDRTGTVREVLDGVHAESEVALAIEAAKQAR